MKIAIASGKGGTGKTTVATNLAHLAARAGTAVAYLDCDVEEPNGHIFLKPDIAETRPVSKLVPRVDADRCTACGQCGEICRYSAIVCIGQQVLVNPDLCHACGGCALVCPVDAITEQPREVGALRLGSADGVRFVSGTLNVGEAMSPPVIRQVKAAAPEAELVILDAPPGTSCLVVETVRGADLVLLVTEPTPFGLNDLKLAVEMVRALKLPFRVIVNRADLGSRRTRLYCDASRIGILAEIPDDREIAEAYSRGQLACEAKGELYDLFSHLLLRIRNAAP